MMHICHWLSKNCYESSYFMTQAGRAQLLHIQIFIEYNMKVKVKSLSRVQLFVTPRTVAHQAPLSTGFSRQEYLSG